AFPRVRAVLPLPGRGLRRATRAAGSVAAGTPLPPPPPKGRHRGRRGGVPRGGSTHRGPGRAARPAPRGPLPLHLRAAAARGGRRGGAPGDVRRPVAQVRRL